MIWNRYHRNIIDASKKDQMSIHSLSKSHAITTTTEKLCKTFGNFNKNVHIIRNMFDWQLPQWNLNISDTRQQMLPEWFPSTDNKIVIGWAGLTSHFEDLRKMYSILKVIHDRYPQTVFVLAGMALKDSQVEIQYDENGQAKFREMELQDKSLTYRNRVEKLYSGIDPKRIKIFDALPLEEYAKFYTLFDISLAYVEHNTFSECKSEIKLIESLYYGAVPVFSNYGGYHDFWKTVPDKLRFENMAVSVTAPKVWTDAISKHVENFEESKKKAADLKVYSDKVYDLNEHIEERFAFYLNQMEKHEEEEVNRISRYSVDGFKIV